MCVIKTRCESPLSYLIMSASIRKSISSCSEQISGSVCGMEGIRKVQGSLCGSAEQEGSVTTRHDQRSAETPRLHFFLSPQHKLLMGHLEKPLFVHIS